MIRKFSVLYVGQIDLDHVGRDGTPADQRRYPNERIAEAYRSMVDVARVMDDEGYYCLWTAEHHFQREGYEVLPNLILVGTYLAAVTRQLKLGCAFNILPMWHPIRLAEDYAVADILTGGRVIMGIGRGYHTREVESFGAPLLDAAANLELFEEQFELMWKALHEEQFSHRGKYYTVPPAVKYRGYDLTEVTMVPRPIHRPVEIWQPIASGKTIDFLAKHNLKGMVTLNGERITDQVFHAFQDACARHGRQKRLGEDLCLGLGFHMAETQGGGDPARRARPRRALQVVRALRLRALRGRSGPAVGHARRARARPDDPRGRRPESLDGRLPRGLHRPHPRVRGEVPGARPDHAPLAGGHPGRGVHRAAPVVRPGRDAGVPRPVTGRTPGRRA